MDVEGNSIVPSVELTGLCGNYFEAEAKIIPNYELTATPMNAMGSFTELVQTVNYIYKQTTSNNEEEILAPMLNDFHVGE